MMSSLRLAALATCLVSAPVLASPCASEDFQRQVSGKDQCLVMRHYGDPAADTLLVWLHGDVSDGGPANYHFPLAQQAVQAVGQPVLSVALVRPGYPDGEGGESTVASSHKGRSDHYTRVNVGEVGAAIHRLKQHYRAQRVIAVGHSGGAATVGVLLGMQPGLIDGAVLVACPCNLDDWRASRNRKPWTRSQSPSRWVNDVPTSTHVVALTGSADHNTQPVLAQRYVQSLQARQVPAQFVEVADATHGSAFRSPAVMEAIGQLLRAR